MDRSLTFRWLGTAGIELCAAGQVLIVDPYFTRIPMRKLLFGPIRPNQGLIAQSVQRCDFVLVTHAHFDHLMDVPDIVANTSATAFGSANACQLLRLHGTRAENVSEVDAGDELALGTFRVEVRSARHVKLPGFGPGRLAQDLEPPLRARDYVMDSHSSFRISVNSYRLLTDPGVKARDAGAADVLFVSAGLSRSYYQSVLALVRPSVVIPIHWDDFFHPLSEPMVPHWKHPRWRLPPLERVDLAEFVDMIRQLAPDTRVLVPEALRTYQLWEFL